MPISRLPPGSDGLIIDAGGYIGTVAIKLAKALPNSKDHFSRAID